jgi:hypothetical protein
MCLACLGYGAEGGHEWTVEGTRAGPRDARRLDVGSEWERGSEGRKIGGKLIKKGGKS